MTIQVYPASPIPSFTYVMDQEYKTLVSEFDSGTEQRRNLRRFSKRLFQLSYRFLSLTDRNTLSDFFRNRRGSYESFWFVDAAPRKWVDEYVGRGLTESFYKAIADDGGVTTDETTAAGNATVNDMTLLPAVPAVNDAYYFGSLSLFDSIGITIGTAGVGVWTITWEYWDGDSWDALAGVSDGTAGFTVTGRVDFTRPDDWAQTTVATFSAYWVRARVSAYTSIVTQPKGTQAWSGLRLYDLHSKTTTNLTVYDNGAVVTPSFVSGGGEASVDRILFTDPPTVGNLITSDMTGYLRIKGRYGEDRFSESITTMDSSLNNFYNIESSIREVQW